MLTKQTAMWCFSIIMVVTGLTIALVRPAAAQNPPPPEVRRDFLRLQPERLGAATTPLATIAGNTVVTGEKLVFQSYRDGNWEIYLMEGNVNNLRRLTADPALDINPRLDRSTNRVVFVSNRVGNYEIYVVNSDGSGLTRLTHNGKNDVNPQWSPDGTKIAFEAYRDGQAEIYVMNADGSNPTRLTNNAVYDGEPTWSPDGKRLAFTSQRTGNTRIWIMNADGSNPSQLPIGRYGSNPSWSPDGLKLAYSGDSDGDGWLEACRIDLTGANSYCFYNPSGQTDAWVGSWAPDSAYVAFTTISFIQYAGTWYWVEAYLEVAPTDWPNPPYQLSSAGVDWNPDWRSSDWLPPHSQIHLLPEYSRAPDVTVTWDGMDAGPAGIQGYDVQYRVNGGAWVEWLSNVYQTSAIYSGSGGQQVDFRVRARDNASNVGVWTDEAAVAHTQLYSRILTGQIYDTRGNVVRAATVVMTPTALNPITFDAAGNFLAYLPHFGDTEIQVVTPGMGRFQRTEPGGASDSSIELWLNPEVNLIQNGDFEAHSTQLSGWQAGGTIFPTVITYTLRSGLNAVDFSTPHVCGIGASSVVSETGYSRGSPALWVDEEDVLHLAIGKSTGVFYLRRDTSNAWTSPVLLGEWGAWNYITFPDLTVTPQGIIHVVWRGEAGIYYNHTLPDGSWQGTEVIAKNGERIVSDRKGVVHRSTSGDDGKIYYSYRPVNGNWSADLYIGEGHVNDLTVGWDDNVYIWTATSYWQRSPEGQWFGPMPVDCGEYGSIDEIAVDPKGTVHVICDNYYFGTDGSYLYKTPGHDWSEREVLPNYGGNGSIAIDSRGTLYLVTIDKNPSLYWSCDAYFRSKPRGGAWSNPVLLQADASPDSQMQPVVRIGGRDLPHIMYYEAMKGQARSYAPLCAAASTQNGALSQTITLPADMSNPTLSFFYDLHGASAQNSEAFTISVADGLTSTVVFSTTHNGDWRHHWIDLSPWMGQTITLTFATQTLAGDSYVSLALDDITLGAYYPDLWIEAENFVSQPGQPVIYKLTYGNQSGLTVPNARIIMPQTEALLFANASPTATFNTHLSQWEWESGTISANSGPHEIIITATVAPSATWFTTYTYTATISAPSIEANFSNNVAFGQLLVARRTYLPLVLRNHLH